jgi:hypothetical protein
MSVALITTNPDVRYWHLADIQLDAINVCFQG